MSKFRVDVYVDDMYVRTEFVEADNIYDAEDKILEKTEASLGFDVEELDS